MTYTIPHFNHLFFRYLLLAALILFPSQATDEISTKSASPSLKKKVDLSITIPFKNAMVSLEDVKIYTEKLLNNNVLPESILLILDVNGTLTNFTNPNHSLNSKNIQARGEAVPFVKNMVDKGVRIVISSAWHSFEETLERLRHLSLEEVLKIPSTQPYVQNDDYILFNDIHVKFCALGLVASIGYLANTSYYSRKAFAYKLVYPDLNEDTITHVVVGDDNEQTIKDFGLDLNILKNKKELFCSAEIKLFTLCKARGETFLK